MNHKILTAGDSDNPIRALNTHGKTGSEATSADTSGPANMEAVAKNVGAIRQESERPAVRTVNEVTLREQLDKLRETLETLWIWASEQRTHLDTDPVPDGLGAHVLNVLQGREQAQDEQRRS